MKVLEPIAVAGLGSGLLATCGRLAMDATPAGTHQLPNFQVVSSFVGTVRVLCVVHFVSCLLL